MPKIRMALLVGCAAVCLAGQGARAAEDAEACRRAEAGPPLTWYSSQDPALNDQVLKAFKAAYPKIRAEAFRLPSGALAARFASERTASVVNASIVSLSDPAFVADGRGKGWFVDFPKADLSALAALDDRSFDRGVARTGINVIGISFNTDLVAGRPPADWKDLLRPEYKGRIALADPRNVPSFVATIRILRDRFGDGFVTALADQNLVVVPSAVPGTQQMAAGEYAAVFPNTFAVVAPVKDKGADVDFVTPALTTGVEYSTMLAAGGSSPDAAKCLYNFLYTEAGQRAFNGKTSVPALPGLAGMATLPPDYQAPEIEKLAAQQATVLRLLRLQ